MTPKVEQWMRDAARKLRISIHSLVPNSSECDGAEAPANKKWLDSVTQRDAELIASEYSKAHPPTLSDKLCELCAPRDAAAMRALESLTPGGSEFVNDIKRCVEHVRRSQDSQMEVIKQFKRRIDELEAHPPAVESAHQEVTLEQAREWRQTNWYDKVPEQLDVALMAFANSVIDPEIKALPSAPSKEKR